MEVINLRAYRAERNKAILTALAEHPELTQEAIAKQFGISRRMLILLVNQFSAPRRKRGCKPGQPEMK